MTDMTKTLKLINDCDEEVHFERQVKRELLRLHDLLGKANALARIRATRIKELEAHSHPASPQPPRQPLADAEIADLLIDLPVLGTGYFLRIARAIEAAHGIKEQK